MYTKVLVYFRYSYIRFIGSGVLSRTNALQGVVSHVQKDTTPRRAPCVNMMALQGIFNTT